MNNGKIDTLAVELGHLQSVLSVLRDKERHAAGLQHLEHVVLCVEVRIQQENLHQLTLRSKGYTS